MHSLRQIAKQRNEFSVCTQRCAIVFFSLLTSLPALASEVVPYYRGVRQMGMGGAYTGVVNDETAVLSNPAGLGKIRDTTFTLIDPEVEAGFKVTDVAKLDDASTVTSDQGVLDALKKSPGTPWHTKYQFFPSLVTTNFGLGVHHQVVTNAEVSSDGTSYRLDYINDYTGALGYCFRFFGGIIKLGANVRYVDRTEVHKDLDPTVKIDMKSIASEGVGVATDVGLILTSPTQFTPAISAVVHDVGNTVYTLNDGYFNETQTRPATTMQTIDAGFSLFPILSNNNRMTFTVEMHDLTNVQKTEDPMRRLHGGIEFNIHDFFFLRAGYHQRYVTGGIELSMLRFQLQASTYGEEIGTWPTTREDRRWVGKFAFRF